METGSYTIKSGDTLLVRCAVVDDAQAVLDFTDRVAGESDFLTFGPGELGFGLEQERALFKACEEADNQAYFLGLVDGQIVATAHVAARARTRLRHRAELGMSVSRAWWGYGLGGALLDHLIAWAESVPVLTKLDLRVRADNIRGLSLYHRRGFQQEGVLKRQVRVGGVDYDVVAMGRDV